MASKVLQTLLHVLLIFHLLFMGKVWNKNLFISATQFDDIHIYENNSENLFFENYTRDDLNNTKENILVVENETYNFHEDEYYVDFTNEPTESETIIEDFKVDNISSDSITISWTVLKNQNSSFYLIEWFRNEVLLVGNLSGIFYNYYYVINHLDSCTKYKIKITSDKGESKITYGTTDKIRPGAPLILTAEPFEESNISALNISWKMPTAGSCCIKHFAVSVNTEVHNYKHNLFQETNSTNIIMKDLFACTSYLVTVKSVDWDNEDGLMSTIQARPTLNKAAPPPELVNNVCIPPFTVTKTTVTLNYEVSEFVLQLKNNCSIKLLIVDCFIYSAKGHGYRVKEHSYATYRLANRNQDVVSLVVENLSSYASYGCLARSINAAGSSWTGLPILITTNEDAPSAPENFHLVNNTNFVFAWEEPKIMPGKLKEYKITLSWKPLYPYPDTCNKIQRTVINDIDPSMHEYFWEFGEGLTDYFVYIEARNGGGWSPKSSEIVFRSNIKSAPDRVTNLNCVIKPLANDSNTLETILSWNLPCSLKGVLKYFNIKAFGSKWQSKNDFFQINFNIENNYTKNDVFTLQLGELKPQYRYVFTVSAVNYESDEKGEAAQYVFEYPAGIPPLPTEDYLQSIEVNPYKIRRTSNSFETLLPLFPNTKGDIQYYAIIVSRVDFAHKAVRTRFNVKHGMWPNISSWRESMEQDFRVPYQASEPYWIPSSNYILDYGNIKAVKFTVGIENSCKDFSSIQVRRLYCNGPLKPDTLYEVTMRAFTNGGYSDSLPIRVKTDAEISVIFIICFVFGILLFGIVVALLLAGKVYFKRKDKNLTAEDGK